MILLATFLGLVIVGQAANVLIAMGVEQISEPVSLALFFVMFAGVFYLAWQFAVRIIDARAKRQGT
jgi:threonine/homoserine/homoserine lactone efflux protein